MPVILQVDFPFTGPFGPEMTTAMSGLAQSIATEPGFLWKIWTESSSSNEAGGIYLFESKESAEKYIEMHTKRLAGFGITGVNAKIFDVNEGLTAIDKGPLKPGEALGGVICEFERPELTLFPIFRYSCVMFKLSISVFHVCKFNFVSSPLFHPQSPPSFRSSTSTLENELLDLPNVVSELA
jgi:hypothetical protein